MSEKTKRIIWIHFDNHFCLMLDEWRNEIIETKQIVTGLAKEGFGGLTTTLGVLELIIAALFIYPAPVKSASCLFEVTSEELRLLKLPLVKSPPNAAPFLAFAWISAFISDRTTFLSNSNNIHYKNQKS